jgi:uncharacterized membrane protein
MLLGLITILGIVEVGYLYWAKRDAQKVADLAALSGAQQLPDCSKATSAASDNATSDNKFGGTLATNACGTWTPPTQSGSDGFSTSGTNPNAVKVVATRPVPSIWGLAGALPDVSAEAVAAQQQPIAAFSVGTTLVNVNGESTLGQLLNTVGIPIDGASLVGYNGLANVDITPAGLLKELGIPVDSGITVGDLNTLLAAQKVKVGDLLNAIVTVAGQNDLVNANATLLNTILADAQVPGIALQDVTLGGPGGLFATIVAPDGAAQAVLNAQVNALQLIATAIGVGTGKHAISNSLNLSLGLLNISASTSVIEPPSMGVGGKGTTAYTAQVRTFINISTPEQGISLLGGAINLQVNLPIAIDLVNAQGTLGDLCSTTDSAGQPQAEIDVNSSLLKTCVGNMTQADAFSTAGGCDQIPGANTPMKLFGLSLAGQNIASLNTSLAINPLPASGSGTLSPGQTEIIPGDGNQLDLGTTVKNLGTALTAALIANAGTQTGSGFSSSGTPTQTATDLWNGTSGTNAARIQQALNEIQTSSQGLQGLLGSVTGSVLDLLGNTVQLNVSGLLGDVGNLLGGLVNGLTGTVNYALCVGGSSDSCIAVISGAMSGGGSGTNSNAFVSLLSFLLQALQPALDAIGTQVLTPILQNVLGLDLGQTAVNLQSLQCHRVQLVY